MKYNLRLKRSTPCIVSFLPTVLSIDAELTFAPEMGPRGSTAGPPDGTSRSASSRQNNTLHSVTRSTSTPHVLPILLPISLFRTMPPASIAYPPTAYTRHGEWSQMPIPEITNVQPGIGTEMVVGPNDNTTQSGNADRLRGGCECLRKCLGALTCSCCCCCCICCKCCCG
ncbi:hypothetical protein EDB86DRAFT_323720 [Lactarius hatsudake]|nr:hypothetical protein EDB86DRAFT_323720 [Lactarius hatsudake]